MQNKSLKRKRFFEHLVFGVTLIVLWQICYFAGVEVFGWWKSYAVPSPLGVAETLFSLLSNGTLIYGIIYSLLRAVIGFAAAVLLGAGLGVLLVASPYLNRNLKPFILGVQTLPSICWVPFAILWFGLKESAVIFVVIMGSAFSVALSVEGAIKNVNPVYIKAALTMGASKKDLYKKVLLPASLPMFVSGLKQAWSFAWRALMSAEVMSASVGLGYTLMLGRDLADINQVMLVMVLIICTGIIIDKFVFSAIERRMLEKRGLL